MKKIFALVIAVTLASSLMLAQSSRTSEVEFKAAQHKEEVVGDFKGAIDQYKRIAQSKDRALAAKALLRMAALYQKLGDAEAQKTYERVVREFRDQKEAVASARARLESKAVQPVGTGIEAIQLWDDGDIEGWPALSSDGRYLVYSSWLENTNLFMKDLTTGVVRPITHDASLLDDGAQPWSPVFSPDGNRIAYSWLNLREPTLRITNRDGSNLRVLRIPNIDFPYAWSPDARRIAVNLYDSGQSRIAIASVEDGSITPLKSTEWSKAANVEFSPDGRFLVYSLGNEVFTLSVDGRFGMKLVDGERPAWTPDGRAVAFVSRRSGNSDLWMVRVKDGKPDSTPEILRRNVQINRGFTRDGSLFYEVRGDGNNVLAVQISSAGNLVAEPALMVHDFVGLNSGATWSPDGKRLALVRGDGYNGRKLVIRSIANGDEKTLTTSFNAGVNAQPAWCRWFPDGRSLLIQGAPPGATSRPGGRVWKKVDIETGVEEVLFSPTVETSPVFDLSPDGRFLFYVRRGSDGAPESRVIRRDLKTGVELELLAANNPRVSPDGSQLAVRSKDGLVVLPLAGGTPVVLQKRPDALEPMAWTRDGRYILGTRGGPGDFDEEVLWAIPAAGGTPVKLNVSAENIRTVSVDPVDGRIAVSVSRSYHELWLVKNLLKPATSK